MLELEQTNDENSLKESWMSSMKNWRKLAATLLLKLLSIQEEQKSRRACLQMSNAQNERQGLEKQGRMIQQQI